MVYGRLVVGAICLMLPFSEQAAHGSSHGEPCGRFQRCNVSAFLNCANGHYCDCIKPHGMIFDETRNICVKLVGEMCSIDRVQNRQKTRPYAFDDAPCVANGECRNEKCECLPGYAEQPNGSCNLSCNLTSHFLMINQTCQLKSSFGTPCTSSGHCSTGLVCRNWTCDCPYKDHQEYNWTHHICQSLIAGPCSSTADCIADSQCVTADYNDVKTCSCSKGFTPVDRKCELSHGQNCLQGDTVRKCDSLAPLECGRDGKCACSDFQIYDGSSLKCKGLVGSRCEMKDDTFCVDGAFCHKLRGFDATYGICTCRDSANFQSDRTCKK